MNDKKVVIMGLLILVVAMFLTNVGRPSGFVVHEPTEIWVTGPSGNSVASRGDIIIVTVKPGSAGVNNHRVNGEGVGIRCQNRRIQGTSASLCGKHSTCESGNVYTRRYWINNDDEKWPSGVCYAYVVDKEAGETKGYFTIR